MGSFLNPALLYQLIDEIDKLEQKELSFQEHEGLQKKIAVISILQFYQKTHDDLVQELIDKYAFWLENHWKKNEFSPKEKTDLFLFKCALSKIQGQEEELSSFDQLLILAEIWKQPLKKERESVCRFLSFFMYKAYGVNLNLSESIFNLINSKWLPTMPPASNSVVKHLTLDEIEQYFFGDVKHRPYQVEVILNSRSIFSIVDKSAEKNWIFLNKKEGFSLFESAQIVCEFQKIQDAVNGVAKSDLFSLERTTLNAEKIFLHSAGLGKKGKYCWFESNFFHPLLLLQCELEQILSNSAVPDGFASASAQHRIQSAPLLYKGLSWGAPFQAAVTCAAAMDLDPAWKKFFTVLYSKEAEISID